MQKANTAAGQQSTDPALEAEGDGRTLLQKRLVTYAVVLAAIYAAYWPGFYLVWSGDPDVGSKVALDRIFSNSNVALLLVYAFIGFGAAGKAKPPGYLKGLDLAGSVGIGVAFGILTQHHPHPLISIFETLLAITGVLSVRALLVPSSPFRTMVAGMLVSVPTAVTLYAADFTIPLLSVRTLWLLYGNWCVVAIAFSSVSSSILYGLRREVRDARRLGQYTLVEKLGEGGMGVVYRAQHALLRRPTAIKLLSRKPGADLSRFEKEVQHMARLTHPNTVAIYDYGHTEDGVFYYAMEHLEGVDLEELVALDGPQSAGRVIHLLRQACGALADAHREGLIHRDVKPANLFLCRRRGDPDVLKVLDFGLVKDVRGTHDGTKTGVHAFIGTPLYMSPESTATPELADARSDLYSLGAVGYLLLVGRTVFQGETTVEVCIHHLHTAPVPPSVALGRAVPEDLEAVILRCLAKNQTDRFQTGIELRAALDACRDAGGWQPDDAEAWWERNQRRIDDRRAERRSLVSGTNDSVCVDHSGRVEVPV